MTRLRQATWGKTTNARAHVACEQRFSVCRLRAESSSRPGGNDSFTEGFNAFVNVGCAQCHTQQLRTGNATVAALRNQNVRLFSDVALHNMGPGLADDIVQGLATGD